MSQSLPLSTIDQILLKSGVEEKVVPTQLLRDRFNVDGLIRLPESEFAQIDATMEQISAFNLERTTNKPGSSYAIVPILRSGYRDETGKEFLPLISADNYFLVKCLSVFQRVAILDVKSEYLDTAIGNIKTHSDLKSYLLDRYQPMFPDLPDSELLSRGCAISVLKLLG